MKNRPVHVTIFSILLIVASIIMFSTWGYQAVNYILSEMFNVDTGSTLYDLFRGIIGMVASALILTGFILIWKMRYSSRKYIMLGSVGFIIKAVFDIISLVIPLGRLSNVTAEDIAAVSWEIAWVLFLIAFWIFIWVFFTRKSLAKQLSR